jgi:hypothetical protein
VALKCAAAGVNLDDLDLCSDLSLNNLLSCVFGGSAGRGEATFQWLYRLTAALVTTTTTSPSTTNTTVTSTTTTTLPLCSVTFGVTTSETLGALQFEANYGSAPGEFVGEGFTVSCTSLVSGASTVIQDDDARRILGAAIIREAGFTGPVDVTRCSFAPSDQSIAISQFAITVIDATTPDFVPVQPTVAITALDCPFN